jgi:thiamine phosphate synthase YjbQ (UPF0047 family)
MCFKFKQTDFIIDTTKQAIASGKCTVRVTHKPSGLAIEETGYGEVKMRDNLIDLLKNILCDKSENIILRQNISHKLPFKSVL